MPDIDIDFADRNEVLAKLKHRLAKLDNGKKHNTGVYVTEIPHNPVDGLSTLDYETAEDRGYFKIDMLNVNLYKHVKSEQELVELMIQEPDWDMLKDIKIVNELFHLNGHFQIVSKLEPRTIEQLAAVLAIIRPAKRNLLYKDWQEIMQEVWVRPSDRSYFFKKSHAIAYAQAIVVQMNLISSGKYSFDATSKD